MLQRAREDADLDQDEVGQAIGRNRVTVSRWENGYAIPDEKLRELLRLYSAKGAEIPQALSEELLDVSRGTSRRVPDLTHVPFDVAKAAFTVAMDISSRIDNLKREMRDAGADGPEMDYIDETFRRPETIKLIYGGTDGREPSRKQVEEEVDALIDGVRHIITRRIERRRKAAKAK